VLLHIVWNILTPIFLIAATGFVGSRWLRMDVRTLSTAAVYVFTPCLVFTSLARTPLNLSAVGQLCTLHIWMTALLAILGWLLAWTQGWQSQRRNALLLTVLVQNAGNYGIPVSRFAFGETATAIAVLYFALMQITANTLGIFLVAAGSTTPRQACRGLLKVPLLYATGLAILAHTFSLDLPTPLSRAVELCASAAVPILLMVLGMQLTQLEVGKEIAPTALAVCLRLIIAPLLAIAITEVLGMQGLVRAVSITQWSVPTAVTTVALALQYECQPRYVAGVILITTLLSMATLPMLLIWLMP
jgi:predicted permease